MYRTRDRKLCRAGSFTCACTYTMYSYIVRVFIVRIRTTRSRQRVYSSPSAVETAHYCCSFVSPQYITTQLRMLILLLLLSTYTTTTRRDGRFVFIYASALHGPMWNDRLRTMLVLRDWRSPARAARGTLPQLRAQDTKCRTRGVSYPRTPFHANSC